MVEIEAKRCKSCGVCVAFCPKKCLEISSTLNEKGYRIVACKDQNLCISCGICNTVCPDVAITVKK